MSATWIAWTLLSIFSAQHGSAPLRRPDIRMDVNLVLVPVTVTDRRGASVLGLASEHFRLFEDKVPQPIVSFAREETAASVGVVFDLSGSMKNKIREAKQASHALFRTAGDDDEAFLITFSSHPDVQTGFTTDLGALETGIALSKPEGSTALVDAVYLGIHRMRQARNSRKALVVISDGLDNHSRYTRPELMALAMESDVQIYTVALFDPPRNAKAIEMSAERAGIALLEELSRATGGLHFAITGTSDIPRVADRIGDALRSLYVIGYRPLSGRPEGYRKIEVKATVPNVRLSARPGYYAAPSASTVPRERRVLRP
jgi:Ca-activated chloride channel homolog